MDKPVSRMKDSIWIITISELELRIEEISLPLNL